MIIVIIVLGAGVVWATSNYSSIPNGERSSSGVPLTIYDASGVLGPCVIVNNNTAGTDYFLPTRTAYEWTTFKSAVSAGRVPGVTLGSCPTTVCAPSEYLVGTTCTLCPAGYFCDGTYKTPCPAGTSSGAGQTSCAL